MTAQIGDKIRNSYNKFDILALSTPIDFSPEEFGIIPGVLSTACWRGFWCEYDIGDSQFLLKTLYINSKDENYPPINGVYPKLEPYPGAQMLYYMGHHIYKDINIPIKYTGKIIAVNNFIQDYIGVDRIRSFKEVVEWTFVEGCLESTIDLSSVIEAFRTELHSKIEKKDVDGIFSRVDPRQFDSLSDMFDVWWVNLL